jgi:hypothetical protein
MLNLVGAFCQTLTESTGQGKPPITRRSQEA